MPTKDLALKKQLIRDGIIGVILLIVLAAAGYFLFDYDDTTLAEAQAKENENTTMRSEHDAIQQDLGTGFEVSAFYNAYTRNHNSDFVLNRETATQLMARLHEKHHLANLALTISPITDMAQDFVHLKSGIMTKSGVRMTFSAVSDSSIYAFIEALERTMPGVVAVYELSFTRVADLSGAVVRDLSQHRITPLVNGSLSFVWLGIRPSDDDKNAPGKGTVHGAP